MRGTILDRILETKRAEVAALRDRKTSADLRARASDMPPTRGFAKALTPFPSPVGGRGEPSTGAPPAPREAGVVFATGPPLPSAGEGEGVRAS